MGSADEHGMELSRLVALGRGIFLRLFSFHSSTDIPEKYANVALACLCAAYRLRGDQRMAEEVGKFAFCWRVPTAGHASSRVPAGSGAWSNFSALGLGQAGSAPFENLCRRCG